MSGQPARPPPRGAPRRRLAASPTDARRSRRPTRPPASSTRASLRECSSRSKVSRGPIRHQPTGTSSTYASRPGSRPPRISASSPLPVPRAVTVPVRVPAQVPELAPAAVRLRGCRRAALSARRDRRRRPSDRAPPVERRCGHVSQLRTRGGLLRRCSRRDRAGTPRSSGLPPSELYCSRTPGGAVVSVSRLDTGSVERVHLLARVRDERHVDGAARVLVAPDHEVRELRTAVALPERRYRERFEDRLVERDARARVPHDDLHVVEDDPRPIPVHSRRLYRRSLDSCTAVATLGDCEASQVAVETSTVTSTRERLWQRLESSFSDSDDTSHAAGDHLRRLTRAVDSVCSSFVTCQPLPHLYKHKSLSPPTRMAALLRDRQPSPHLHTHRPPLLPLPYPPPHQHKNHLSFPAPPHPRIPPQKS